MTEQLQPWFEAEQTPRLSREAWLEQHQKTQVKIGFVEQDAEWEQLIDRIGRPRITEHPYWPQLILDARQQPPGEGLSVLDLGVGHGNDLRTVRDELTRHGQSQLITLGVDISERELKTGIDYFSKVEGEDPEISRQWFAQGNFLALPTIQRWDSHTQRFSKNDQLAFSSVTHCYMEATLQGLGRGETPTDRLTDEQKCVRGLQLFQTIFQLLKPGGVFFGRENVRLDDTVSTRIIPAGIEAGLPDWRFHPTIEQAEMLFALAGGQGQPGFQIEHKQLLEYAEHEFKPDRTGRRRYVFVVQKPKD